ncbi:alpha/beta hydrolase [Marinobacterium mangrovicola]|uniref:Esterase/PHB depolymerase n=1 Tax=Marinobacterium mangrovicola TaxID=1476959 RepID=A0A4R1GPD0_9GAMM|nr:alpha/beta hydrolase [Marinobacterium mangrovicola]TCK09173.1 hypothetical protein CLV83_1277 [Marinobacterium mangrovicola]
MRQLQKRYFKGLVPFTACKADSRFSYCAYVPERCGGDEKPLPLLVVVHGSARTAESFRDHFIEFAEQQGCVILAPLFPVGSAGDEDGYKLKPPLSFRYDRALLHMVSELGERYRLEQRFYLFGFSGGAQFAHRFWYLNASRVRAISIAAPGSVSLPAEGDELWKLASETQQSLEAGLVDVPAQLLIGEEDCAPKSSPSETKWPDRQESLKLLARHLVALGVNAQHQSVAGVAHDGFALIEAAQEFLAQEMRRQRRC